MEGLTLQVRADVSMFEAAMARLNGLGAETISGLTSTFGGLEAAAGGVTAGVDVLNGALLSHNQLLGSAQAGWSGYRAGLAGIQGPLTEFGRVLDGAAAGVAGLTEALNAVPRQVEIDISINQNEQTPNIRSGGIEAVHLPTAHEGAYFSGPGPEERDVRVLSGEYVLSRLGVQTLGLDRLRRADQGIEGPGGGAVVENHYHYDSVVRIDGSVIADDDVVSRLAERIGRELDWQAGGRTG